MEQSLHQGIFKDERKRTFLNAEGADKPLKSPVPPDVLERARAYRIGRIRKHGPDKPATINARTAPVWVR